jgi:hypothetical protein
MTEARVRALRNRYAAGDCTLQALATEYGISTSAAGNLPGRLTWTHLSEGGPQ